MTFFGSNSGYYQMTLGTQSVTTYFDATNPSAMAAVIRGAVQSLVPNTTVAVTYNNLGGAPYTYTITFGDTEKGIAISPADPAYSPLLTPLPAVAVLGTPIVFPLLDCETYGETGTEQYATSIGMERQRQFRDGLEQATQNRAGIITNTNLYFRTFQESTDTAGPLVTDFLLPTGGDTDLRLNNGATINQPLHDIVVTFDSDMMTTGGATGANSVLNPNNWSLMDNGVLVTGGITQIYYGMNEAATQLGMPASNKWEAVLVLNGSGDSQNVAANLTDGHYQIVATTALRNVDGNALGRNGFMPNGITFSRDFNVSIPTGSETRVNATIAGDQDTSPSDEIQRITLTPTGAAPSFTIGIGSFTGWPIAVNTANLNSRGCGRPTAARPGRLRRGCRLGRTVARRRMC